MNYVERIIGRTRDHDCFGERDLLAGIGRACVDGAGFGLPAGGLALIRQPLHPYEGLPVVVGFLPMGASSDQVVNHDGHPHAASQSYRYWTRFVAGNMRMDDRPPEPIRLDFDAGGALIDPGLPNRPYDVAATPLIDGKFRVEFTPKAWGQGSSPTGFKVFGGDPVDWGTPLTDSVTGLPYVAFEGFDRVHAMTTAAYADGLKVAFGARAYNAAGAVELNEYATPLVAAIASGPAQFTQALDGLQGWEWTGGGGPLD